ncbi:MAG: AmmeMemoRadiSam system radical SAM enzyme [Candidatus Omnitrophota bacterium]
MKKTIECLLCPRACRLKPGQRGDCRVRLNLDGKLQTLVYGSPCSIHVDPIEKKPLFHVLPGSSSFSIATAGCNLHCKYCQNWQISQQPPEALTNYNLSPEQTVQAALSERCRSIAYTYSDPVVFYEYTYDTSKLANISGILNVLVTAGYINQQPLIDLCPHVHAANVDLKGITDQFYQRMSQASLKPVQDAIITMKKNHVWVEITNLVVPTWNDRETDIRDLCKWVKDYCGEDTPLHFSKFWPMHQLKNLPPTPTSILDRAWEIGRETGLKYVYVGNIPGHAGNSTYCPSCKKILIERAGFRILQNNIVEGRCGNCGEKIPGIWK